MSRAAGRSALALACLAWLPLSFAAQPFVVGHLMLSPCTVGARTAEGLPTLSAHCAAVSVPEDWRQPGGRQIHAPRRHRRRRGHTAGCRSRDLSGWWAGRRGERGLSGGRAGARAAARSTPYPAGRSARHRGLQRARVARRPAATRAAGIGELSPRNTARSSRWLHECLVELAGRAAPAVLHHQCGRARSGGGAPGTRAPRSSI